MGRRSGEGVVVAVIDVDAVMDVDTVTDDVASAVVLPVSPPGTAAVASLEAASTLTPDEFVFSSFSIPEEAVDCSTSTSIACASFLLDIF